MIIYPIHDGMQLCLDIYGTQINRSCLSSKHLLRCVTNFFLVWTFFSMIRKWSVMLQGATSRGLDEHKLCRLTGNLLIQIIDEARLGHKSHINTGSYAGGRHFLAVITAFDGAKGVNSHLHSGVKISKSFRWACNVGECFRRYDIVQV